MALAATMSPTTRTDAKSAHVSDSNVQPFLQADFDPADYLNATLPSLSTSTAGRNTTSGRTVLLPELSAQIQTLLSQLNAQTSRLSNALTQLTDEIIRSGGRLGYEVEVLRGETIGLTDSLENGLREDIEIFAPRNEDERLGRTEASITEVGRDDKVKNGHNVVETEYLERLRTLTAVRARLNSVIKVFGEAMQWPLAPSELSIASSLISLSAPGTSNDTRNQEEKGKAYAERIRNEILDLMDSGNDISGLEAAIDRIEGLKRLTEVWKGTAEEKARMKLVESLQKPVEEKQRAIGQSGTVRRPAPSPSRGVDYRYGNMDSARSTSEGGYGFLQNLRNLRNDVYFE